jgi:hypothetical protein
MRLRRILDNGQVVTVGDPDKRAEVCGLAVQVHRQNGSRPRRDGGLGGGRVERQAIGIDVGEDRPGPGHHDRQRRIGGRERRRDDFVSGADVEGPQDQRDRVGARADAHGVWRAGCCGELGLEGFHLRAEHEPARPDDATDGLENGGRVLAGRQGVERDGPGAVRHSEPCAAGNTRWCGPAPAPAP